MRPDSASATATSASAGAVIEPGPSPADTRSTIAPSSSGPSSPAADGGDQHGEREGGGPAPRPQQLADEPADGRAVRGGEPRAAHASTASR